MAVQVIPWQMTDADGNLLSPNTYTNTIYDPDGNNVTGLATEREIGNAYDSSKTYPTYSPYCIHNNKFYKYSGASGTTTTGAWDSTKWTETPIANELSLLNSNLAEFASIISVDFPSATIAALGFSSQDITSIIPSGMTPISCRLKRTGQSNALIPYIYTYGRTIYVQIYNAYNGQNNQQCTVEVTCIKQPA